MTEVFLNARFLTQPVSGVQRYAHEMLRAVDGLLEAHPGTAVTALYPKGADITDPRWQRIRLRALPGGRGHVWEQGALWQASRDGLLIGLCNSGPVLHRNHVLALHDANIYAIPGAFSLRYRAFHKMVRPRLAQRATRLITVSNFSAKELARHCNVSASVFHVLPNSAEHVLQYRAKPDVLEHYGLKRGQYLLTVGNQSPNKNITRLIEAYSVCAGLPTLVVVGGTPNGLARNSVRRSTGIRVLGRVEDGELRALYEAAQGFFWPSCYEGFGIPPLEAMTLGIPVVASRSSAMPEVLGDAALYFDPNDTRDVVRALRDFQLLDSSARTRMRRLGLARSRRFSWKASASVLLRLITEIQTTHPEK